VDQNYMITQVNRVGR